MNIAVAGRHCLCCGPCHSPRSLLPFLSLFAVTAGVGSVSARNGQNAQAEATASDAAVVKSPPAGLVDDAMADLHISTLMPVRGGGSGGDGDVDDEYEGGICPPLRAVG